MFVRLGNVNIGVVTLNSSRTKFPLGRRVVGRFSRVNIRCGSCNYCSPREFSCTVTTRGTYSTIISNSYSGTILYYKAKVKVSVTTGGMGKVHTTTYSSCFDTGCAELRGSTGYLYLKSEMINTNLTLRLISIFVGAKFRNNHRTAEINRVVSVRTNGGLCWTLGTCATGANCHVGGGTIWSFQTLPVRLLGLLLVCKCWRRLFIRARRGMYVGGQTTTTTQFGVYFC